MNNEDTPTGATRRDDDDAAADHEVDHEVDHDVAVDVDELEVLIVGGGISGLGAARALLRAGVSSLAILERAPAIGGVWRDNTYPGVAVDIPVAAYCFRDAAPFSWTRVFAPGDEILRYLQGLARDEALASFIKTGVTVERAVYQAAIARWELFCSDGRRRRARFLVAATGLFTTPVLPDIPGREAFLGAVFHSSRWDHGVSLDGRRVAVIGTGASAVQIVPSIAARVRALHVFQRTPAWVAPRLDRPLSQTSLPREWQRRLERAIVDVGIAVLTGAATSYQRFPWAVHAVQRLVRAWMARQVTDPTMRAALLPSYTLGCKRPASSNTYLATFNQPHVSLVTAPIRCIDENGLVLNTGDRVDVDVIVMATGFLTTERGTGPAFTVVGENGQSLDDVFDADRLQSYRGVAVPGFPNFFLTSGPYAGGFNWFDALEDCVAQLVACVREARGRGAEVVEVDPAAHHAWMAEMWRAADGTVFRSADCTTAHSYYLDRHGDASLPLPHTPWWRRRQLRGGLTQGFAFSRVGAVETHGRHAVAPLRAPER